MRPVRGCDAQTPTSKNDRMKDPKMQKIEAASPEAQSADLVADNVAQLRAGKDKACNALVGQIMKASKGKANPQQVNELLRAKLAR